MVSLGRLLAAASDSPDSSQGHSRTSQQSANPRHWLQDHALSEEVFSSVFGPEGSNAGLVPGTLRRAFSAHTPFLGEPVQSQISDQSSIPLDQYIADLGPEATTVQNMVSLKRALLRFGCPSEKAIAKAFVWMAGSKRRGRSEMDSEAMPLFQLMTVFESDGHESSKDPISPAPSALLWNFEAFVLVINEVADQSNSRIDWQLVIRFLDCEDLASVLDTTTFADIAKAYTSATGGSRIPASSIVEPWQNQRSQNAILSNALLSPELVDWESVKTFPGATPEDSVSPYSRVNVLERMVDLDIRASLTMALSSKPDLVLLSLACAKPENNTHIQQQLIVSLVSSLISKFPASTKTIRQMWKFAPALIAGGLLAMWRKDTSSASLVLDIALDNSALQEILGPPMPFEFAFDIALLTYKRQPFPLETWLSEYFVSNGTQALTHCILQLAERIVAQDPSGVANLSLDAVRIVFRCLYTSISTATRHMSVGLGMTEDLKRVHDAYVRHDPRTANLERAEDIGDRNVLMGGNVSQEITRTSMPAHNDSLAPISTRHETMHGENATTFVHADGAESNGQSEPFSKDVEEEVNVHFHSLYKGAITTEQAVDLLRRLQVSDNPRDRKVFACMIHTLFDEYRFFKNYPDKELRITGLLFGAFVQYSLFQGSTLEVALERVLDALQQVETNREGHDEISKRNGGGVNRAPFDSTSTNEEQIGRMTKFGLCALDRFRKRLPEWPQYCARILAIPHLKLIAPELLGEVESIVNKANNYASSGTVRPGFVSDAELGANVRTEIPASSSPELSALRDGPSASVLASPSRSVNNHRMSPTLEAASKNNQDFETPEDAVCEKISFIFNNLSSSTLEDKKDQLVEFLRPEHFPYFIHYVVVKRALNEANHHDLYIQFLDKLTSHIPRLFKLILDKSFENVQILLSSDKIATNSSERVLLRTLGAWIGALTLGRNKPILARDLDLKKLLLDAYTRGRLSPVVPFVAKVLVGSQTSKVFVPSNPWLKAMLSILKEISQVEDLKLNLKFELPSLLATLKIDGKDIVPSNLLKDVQEPSRLNNPDIRKSPQASPRSSAPSPDIAHGYSNRAIRGDQDMNPVISLGTTSGISTSMTSGLGAGLSSGLQSHVGMGMSMASGQMNNTGMGNDTVADLASVLAGASILPRNHNSSIHSVSGNGATNVQSGAPANGQMVSQQQVSTPSGPEPTIIPNFAQYVAISPSLGLFQASPNLKSLLPIAIDRALKDIIQPVVERSCAIASLTTRELTLKDFANEPNVAKIRKAAQQMVQQLAGSLALVTCKEPLRVSMGNHVRSILTSAVGADPALIDQTAHVICAANLEMGCAIIEKAAKEKAVRDLSEVIGPAFSSIRRQQQTGYGLSGPPGPDVLKVYADFSRLPKAMLGEGARVTPPPVYPPAAPIIPLAHSIGANTNAAMGASMSLSPSSGIEIPSISASQGPMLAEKLQDPRFGIGKESIYSSIRPMTSSGLHNEISGPSLDTIGESASSNARAMGSGANVQAANVADWAPGIAPRSPPLMAPPAAMAAAMHKVVGASSITQSARLQHNLHASMSVSGTAADETLSTPQVLEKFNLVYSQLISVIAEVTSMASAREVSLAGLPGDHEIHHLWTQIPLAVKKSVTADEASMAVAQKVFKRLYEGTSSLYREVHVALLDGLRESCRRLSKELVIWLAYSEERKKLNRECIVALLKPKSLINITSYDELLSKTIDNGRNTKALDFAAFLVQRAVIDEPLATPAELALTLETMAKIGRRPSPPVLSSAPNGLLALVEAGRNASTRPALPSGNNDNADPATAMSHKGHKDIDHADPAGSREFVSSILTEWQRMVTNEVPHQVLTTFLGHIRSKTLSTEESRERFCRLAVEMVAMVTSTALLAMAGVDGVTSELADAPYTAVESTVRLVSALCRAETNHSNDSLSRSSLILNSFLTALVKNILRTSDHGDVRPHYRLFIGLLVELSAGFPPADTGDASPGAAAQSDNNAGNTGESEYVLLSRAQAFSFLDGKNEGLLAFAREASGSGNGPLGGDGTIGISNFGVLAMFVGALMACAPRAAPGFSFCWLQLISGRNIMPRLLNASTGKGWLLFRQLLVSMLAFLSPHLRRPQRQLSGAIKHLYKGTLRVLLVLLHDFPEFLCDYHFALCDVIPSNCIQLRNLVLAAFPKNMRLPDPFRAELQAGQLPEMSLQPRILSNYTGALVRAGIKGVIDNFLQNATFRGSITKLDLSPRLMLQKSSSGDPVYNIPAINALVLYVGQHALSRSSHSSALVVNGAATKFFQTLLKETDAEGQYHLFNAIANQLRYPNIHTHYFSSVLLHLFKEARQDTLKEQITRVLVERLIANRPHPWGLLITFIDLIKNPAYNFWTHGFVRCAPQIEHLFENVARFCIGPALQQNSVVAG